MAEPHRARERRADLGLRDLRLDQRDLCFEDLHPCERRIVLVLAQKLLLDELGRAALTPSREVELARRGTKPCAQIRVIELDEEVAGLDGPALFEMNRHDAPGSLRPELDGLGREQRARRADDLGERLRSDDEGVDA